MAERAIRKERNVWMGSDTESAKQMLLRARNTHLTEWAVDTGKSRAAVEAAEQFLAEL